MLRKYRQIRKQRNSSIIYDITIEPVKKPLRFYFQKYYAVSLYGHKYRKQIL